MCLSSQLWRILVRGVLVKERLKSCLTFQLTFSSKSTFQTKRVCIKCVSGYTLSLLGRPDLPNTGSDGRWKGKAELLWFSLRVGGRLQRVDDFLPCPPPRDYGGPAMGVEDVLGVVSVTRQGVRGVGCGSRYQSRRR